MNNPIQGYNEKAQISLQQFSSQLCAVLQFTRNSYLLSMHDELFSSAILEILYVCPELLISKILLYLMLVPLDATEPTTRSFLSRLMTKTSAGAADVIRFVFDDKDEALLLLPEDGRDDDNDSTDSSTFGTFGTWWNLWRRDEDKNVETVDDEAEDVYASPVRKKARNKYARKPQAESLWSTHYLTVELRDEYLGDPHGREAKKFRRLFRVPYDFFVVLVAISKERWWPDWTPEKLCNAGKLVSSLELKVLGALFVLGHGVSHHVVGIQTHLSEEVHRVFFLSWLSKMSSISTEYIYMPKTEEQFEFVVGEYSARGLPGCVGSVDVVHVGWDKCPHQHLNMYKGKEGFPSIAYEVICSSRKFIQSVSVGHPGTRNDKHIVRTDYSVVDLLQGNGWLQSKAWKTRGPNGTQVQFFGVYLICDGGYLRWPCLISPVKTGPAGSPVMKWSAKVESVRKDIEGVFGILKQRFKFLKNFNNLHQQSDVDNAFVTCCMLYNMLLEHDGWLEKELAPYPGGVEARLFKKFGNIYANAWNGMSGLW